MRTTRSAPRLLGLLTTGALLLSTACGFQARKEEAEFVIDTPDRVRDRGTARIVWAQELTPIEVDDPQSVRAFGLPFRIGGDLDLSDRRSTAFVVGDAGPSSDLPLIAFDGDVVFLRRLTDPEGPRPWVSLDLSEVEEERIDDPTIGFNALNPAVWVDLLGGALTGSIEEVATEEVGGRPTTRYRLNVDREKAFDDLPDDRIQDLEEMFLLLGAEGIVTPAELWLDEEGLPRRFVYELEQRVDRRTAFRLTLTFDMSEFGTPVEITTPSEDEVIRVDGLRQLLAEFGADELAPRMNLEGAPAPGPGAGG